jgi:hypothetical protein
VRHHSAVDPFLAVVVLVSLLALVGSVIALATSGRSYEQIGRGGLSLAERGGSEPPAAVSAAERDAEIRQYLAARNERRVARGEAPVDVEAELLALTAPAADPALEAEVRELVIARNARRIARGEPPLDVDAEVSRRLRAG